MLFCVLSVQVPCHCNAVTLFYSVQRTYVIARSCPLWGPQKILCTFGEKAHTNKRVSVIACDNSISKVQCAPCGMETASKTIKVFMRNSKQTE